MNEAVVGPEERRYWAVHLGEGGKYVDQARRGDFIAIGWHEMGDLSRLAAASRDVAAHRLRELYASTYGGTKLQIGLSSGQIWNFVREMQIGDFVLVPDPMQRVVMIGRVTTQHHHREDWGDDCPYPNRRGAGWIKEVARDDISQKLRYTLGSLLTVFSLDSYAGEIMQILGTREVTGEQLVQAVIAKLYELDGYQFQDLVAEVMGTMGFTTVSSPPGPDRGTDVVGVLNAAGLTNVTFRIQVKRLKGTVGIGEVRRIRGVLGQEEQAAIVSLGGFTKQAQEEAQNPRLRVVTLMDGETLVEHILRHYDEIGSHVRDLIPLRRRQIHPAEQFVMVTAGEFGQGLRHSRA
jgi:restriction system protein